jgi:hypothetical protein
LGGILNPASAIGSLAVTIGGIVTSAFAYILGETAYERYSKWRHRFSVPFLVNEKTTQYNHLLTEAFEQLKQHPYFNFFKVLRGANTNEEAFSFFKDYLRLGEKRAQRDAQMARAPSFSTMQVHPGEPENPSLF